MSDINHFFGGRRYDPSRRAAARRESRDGDPGPATPAARRRGSSRPGGAGAVEPAKLEQLVRLLAVHQQDLLRFLLTFLPNMEDAREAFQETQIALFRKLAEFDLNQPFLPLAFGFAHQEILKQRERNKRARHHLSPDVIDVLVHRHREYGEVLQAELDALDACLNRLPPADRDLITQRYHGTETLDDLAGQTSTSRRTLCRNLGRIRKLLLECVRSRLGSDSR